MIPGHKTTIPCLGEAKIANEVRPPFVSDNPLPFLLDEEHGADPEGSDLNAPYLFELAGPREKIYFDPHQTKVAIVTCGGLCPGLNDVIRAIVLQCHYGYGIPVVLGIRYGLEGFIPRYGHPLVELTPKFVSDIHTIGGTVLGTSRGPQNPEEIVDSLDRMNVNILFVIGGDGSMKAASAIQREIEKRGRKISVIGIPKTIDNDINFVARSFGFDTAVNIATEALSCAHTEALSAYNGIGLVKLMGRESGFIAAHATLALNVVNYVLIPEAPFKLEGEGGLLNALEERLKDRHHAVIVTAEGAGQELLQASSKTDASGNRVLEDIGSYLQKAIKKHFAEKGIPITLKYIDPSYIVRSTPANTTDRLYCGQLGRNAVHAAMAGKTGMVVASMLDRYVHLPLELVTRRRRKLDINSSYWRSVLDTTGQHLA